MAPGFDRPRGEGVGVRVAGGGYDRVVSWLASRTGGAFKLWVNFTGCTFGCMLLFVCIRRGEGEGRGGRARPACVP